MNYLNPKTKQKIKKITSEAFNKFGAEVTELTNYKEIVVKENDRLVEPMSKLTLNKWMGYITVCIHNLHREAIKEKEKNNKEFAETQYIKYIDGHLNIEPGNYAETLVIKENVKKPTETNMPLIKTIMYSINFYSDGTFEKIKPVEVKKEEEYILYLGLFDYNHNKVVIQKGGYKGCNVKNKQSILDYFRTMKKFEEWCVEKMEDVFSGRLNTNPDTSKDMATLNKIINEIEIKRRLGSF